MSTSRNDVQNVIAKGHRRGEYDSYESTVGKPLSDKTIKRMIEFIKKIFIITKKHHCNSLAENPRITTQVVLTEFSLYTLKAPLSLSQYKEIIAAVALFSKDLLPNIQITIATLPVLWPCNESYSEFILHNVGMFVCSNKNAELAIYHFDKTIPYASDPDYRDEKNNRYRKYDENQGDYYDTPVSPTILLKDTAICLNSINQYRNAFSINLKNYVVIEVCYMHEAGCASQYLFKLLKNLMAENKNFPENIKVIHTLSASTISVIDDNVVGTLVHADTECDPKNLIKISTEDLDDPGFGNDLELNYFLPSQVERLNTGKLMNLLKENIMRMQKIIPITSHGARFTLFQRQDIEYEQGTSKKPGRQKVFKRT